MSDERAERRPEDDDRERRRRDDDRDRERPVVVNVHQPKSKLPLILGIVIGVMLVCCGGPAILIGLIGVGAKVQEDKQKKQVEQAGGANGGKQIKQGEEAAKLIEVSAGQLIAEYKDNAAKADIDYKGKVLQVSGPIKRITERWVELKGDGQFEFLTVDCHFDDKSVMASLSSGSQVTIKGACDGKGFGGINIRHCQLVNK